jgi:hypothetical protein
MVNFIVFYKKEAVITDDLFCSDCKLIFNKKSIENLAVQKKRQISIQKKQPSLQ